MAETTTTIQRPAVNPEVLDRARNFWDRNKKVITGVGLGLLLLGGGYLASGSGDASRLPSPWLPPGLALDAEEGAGEVQTPLSGDPARDLQVGDRVYMRHAKAGELCERFDSLYLVEGGEGSEPEEIVLGDRQLQLFGAVWAALFAAGVYLG